jgi:hypothetical protein
MNRPGLRTLLLGSRLTAPPIMLGSAYVTYRWWESGGYGLLGFVAIALFLASLKAMGQVAAYRRWRADWRAMSPQGAGRSWRLNPATIASILVSILVGLGMIWVTGSDAPAPLRGNFEPMAVGLALFGIALVVGRAVWTRWRRRRDGALSTVTLAIRGPVLRAPSLGACYRRLPPYCQQLITDGR